MQQFCRGLSPFLHPELCILGTVRYAVEEHECLRWKVGNDITIQTTAEAYVKALATEKYLKVLG